MNKSTSWNKVSGSFTNQIIETGYAAFHLFNNKNSSCSK